VGLPRQVLLVGLGDVPARLLADVANGLREALGIASRAATPLGQPAYAFNKDRCQYHAPAILRRLSALRPSAASAPVMGLVDVDLFLPETEYVIGEADRSAGVAVFSTARLQGEADALRHRACAEAVHCVGCLLGLSSCLDYRCAMFASRDALDSDRKGPGLCPSCRVALGL